MIDTSHGESQLSRRLEELKLHKLIVKGNTVHRSALAFWILGVFWVIPAKGLELTLKVSSQDITVNSPLCFTLTAKNEERTEVTLREELCSVRGSVTFQLQAPNDKEFQSKHRGAVFQGESFGLYPYTLASGETRECYELFLPSKRRPSFDEPGVWKIRAAAHVLPIKDGKVPVVVSNTIEITVRPLSGEEDKASALEANMILYHHFSSEPLPSASLLALQNRPGVGDEMKKQLKWLASVATIQELDGRELSERYKDALKVQAELDEPSRLVMALFLAKVLGREGETTLVKEQLDKLHPESYQRKRIMREFKLYK